MKKILKYFLYLILSFIICNICFISIDDYQIHLYPSSYFLCFCIFIIFVKFNKNMISKSTSFIICSIFFGILSVIGKEYDVCYEFLKNLNFYNSFLIFFQIILFSIIFYFFVFILLNDLKQSTDNRNNSCMKLLNSNKLFKIFFFILLAWFPYILLSYGGVLHWDAFIEIAQYFHIKNSVTDQVSLINQSQYITTHHSVLYTYLLGNFTKIINPNVGLYLFNVLEMLFMIFCISKMFLFLNQNIKQKKILSYMFMFICFFPTLPYYFSFIEKDTLFAAIFILFIIDLYKLSMKQEYNLISLIITTNLLILLRNNVIYVIILYLLYLLIKKYSCKNILILLLSIFLIIIGSQLFYTVNQITSGSKAEMLSVPFQQTARYVNNYEKEVTKYEREVIDKVLDYDKLTTDYNPKISDPIKGTFNQRKPSDDELKDYFNVWFQMFLKHPLCYVESIVINQIDNFYLFQQYRVYRSYVLGKTNNQFSVKKDWAVDISSIGYQYDSNLNYIDYKFDTLYLRFAYLPIINIFCFGAIYIWLFIISVTNAITIKNKNYINFSIFFILYLLTILLGPCSCKFEFRYLYPFIVTIPIFMMSILHQQES